MDDAEVEKTRAQIALLERLADAYSTVLNADRQVTSWQMDELKAAMQRIAKKIAP